MLCQVGHAQPLPEIVRDPGNMLLKSWGVLPFHEPANQHVDCLGDLPRGALSLLWTELLPAPGTHIPPLNTKPHRGGLSLDPNGSTCGIPQHS